MLAYSGTARRRAERLAIEEARVHDDSVAGRAGVAFDVDNDVLRDVLEAIGTEQADTFVKSIADEIELLVGHLNVGGNADALDAVGREAHHLGGGCRSMGLVGIGAVCARIETDARARIDHQWPAYSAELVQLRKALSDWWASVPADPRLAAFWPT